MSQGSRRFKTLEVATVEVYGKNGSTFVSLKNLSSSGACLEIEAGPAQLREGDLIRMTVNLRNIGRKHFVNAEVVWSEGGKSGVSFIPYDKVLDRLLAKAA